MARESFAAKESALVHFTWMGAYYSCSRAVWDDLQRAIANDQPFDLDELGARELRRRPAGRCLELHDVEPRTGTER